MTAAKHHHCLDHLPGTQDTGWCSQAPVMLRYQRSGNICSRVTKSWSAEELALVASVCLQEILQPQGALGLLPECQQVALSLQGHERSWTLGELHTWWQWRSCPGHGKMQQGGKGLCRKGGEMSAWSHVVLWCFVPAINPSAAAGQRSTGNVTGMQNEQGAQGISQAGGNRRFFRV